MMASTPTSEASVNHDDFESQLGYDTGSERDRLAAKVRGFLDEELSTTSGYIPLLVCCFVTGVVDGTLYNEYGTFVSMQTGNTIFVALGAWGQDKKPYGWAHSLCSIGCYTVGCWAFAKLHDLAGPRLRGTVVLSFSLQSLFVAVSAAIPQAGVIDSNYPFESRSYVGLTDLVMVALISFQAAGQIVTSRKLGIGEVPTLVITSLLCDLVIDGNLFAGFRENTKRNLRAAAFSLTLAGAIAGGCIAKATGTVKFCLWLTFAIKAFVTMLWMMGAKR
ncbi:hypothetical protein PG990_000111 [Apiospora arundinis]|uniref:DUF1275 domain protein n=1 Tax=Apiospora arundinis TaxID=335852 RepID=A0ABR2HY75_9PEZI